ncbi:MAG: hypothetical protein K9K65_12760 [Desulfarculaceae bacterium]|nr:hypothetical protein [Desulfarculaceae bacterium]MCF8047073.1 hypothetical protein [Desulfarculaceae bacterium]MCF8098703.1 hypothetical protein [Desulfarculaceae bacterium]MCF8123933.1 hypothetical protein [Desulfarculaceae bacterium]
MAESTRGNLIKKEGLASLVALALLGLAAVFYPLAPVAVGPSDQAQAPWIFVGLQELLRWLPVRIGGLLLPALGLALLAALPWLAKQPGPALPSYVRPSLVDLAAWAVLLTWAVLTWWALGF